MSDTNPAGWQADPTGRHEHRYWDGADWTDNVSDGGVAGTDAFAGATAPEPAAPSGGDPTAATPVPPTDPTTAWSTTPGAPVPPLPQTPADGSGGGGSKKGLLVGGAILAAIALAVIAFLALGGDDSDDDLRAKLITALSSEDQGNLSDEDAECVADAVMDDVDSDVLADVDFSSEDVPDELAAAVAAGYVSCVGTDGDTSTTETTESTDEETTTTEASSDDGGFTDTGGSLPDDFEEMLADTYETTFNLSREQAECLAGKLADSIESGDLSEDEAGTAIFDYLSDCDISLEEIGAN